MPPFNDRALGFPKRGLNTYATLEGRLAEWAPQPGSGNTTFRDMVRRRSNETGGVTSWQVRPGTFHALAVTASVRSTFTSLSALVAEGLPGTAAVNGRWHDGVEVDIG